MPAGQPWGRLPSPGRTGAGLLRERGALTDVIVGLANVIVPDRDVQGLLRQVTVFDVIEELLDARGEDMGIPSTFGV